MQIQSTKLLAYLLLLITTIIWGFGFVAQKVAMDSMQPFFFNAIRFSIAAIILLAISYIFKGDTKENIKNPKRSKYSKGLIISGSTCGVLLFIAATMQQIGISETTASKTAFITGIYMVLVPIIGSFFKHRTSGLTWITSCTALLGLALLVLKNDWEINIGDMIVFVGSIFWALHVLYIHEVVGRFNAIKLTLLQITTTAILSYIFSFIFETITLKAIYDSMIPLLYSGVLATAIAYLFQIMGQRYILPTHAALILSLEVVFGAIGGILFLGESITFIQSIGCFIMFLSILMSQIRIPNLRTTTSKIKNDNEF